MRGFFKQLYRYSHPRNYWHNENIWPYVKIERCLNTGEIINFLHNKKCVPIVPLSQLRNSCQGPILLTATGPSVKDICLDNFPAMPAMGVNGAYFLRPEVNFQFYVIVDMGFIDQRFDIIEDVILTKDMVLFTTVHGIVKIIDKFTLAKVRCRFAVIENAAVKIYQPKITADYLWQHYRHNKNVSFSPACKTIAFNHDIRGGIFDAGTVVYWAFQIITFLGFKQIFIVGLDMNNFQLPRFYETVENMQPTFLPEKVDNVIIPAFSHASDRMKLCDINIMNFSLGSAIDSTIFEKVDSNVFFKKN